MTTNQIKREIYTTYRFLVEIDGITQATFSECSGLQSELETQSWTEGGNNLFAYTLPVRAKWSNIVLKWGLASADLWNWYYQAVQGKLTRKNLSIVLYGHDKMAQVRWNITAALPVKWNGPTFKGDASEAAVETIELVHEGFTRV